MTTAVAQDRLTQRFEKWDTNGDGVLELADFREEAHLIAEAFAKAESSPETRKLMAAFTGLFDYLTSQAGARDSLSWDQFRVVMERLIFDEGETAFNEVMGPVVDGIIGMCDDNHDGNIDGDEFAIWLGALGVEREEARTAFTQIDSSGDGLLSTEELLAAVRNFHFGRLDIPLLG